MKAEHRSRRAALAIAAAPLLAPCAARAQTAPRLRIGTSTTGESFMEGIFALEGGFLKQAGIEVDVSSFVNGGAATAALAGGAVDLTISNIGSLAAAYVRGVPLCMVAPSAVYVASPHPTTALLVARDAPIRAALDLAGKTIALSTVRDLQQAATNAWLEAGGVDLASVRFVEVPNPEQGAALAAHRVDAATMVEPFVTIGARAAARIVAAPYDALAPRLTTTAWIAQRAWAEANLPLLRRFAAAIRTTAQWTARNRETTGAILTRVSKIAPDIVAAMGRATYGETTEPATIQPGIDAAARYGFLPRSFAATELLIPGL